MKSRGFTLIELLVVIAIIGLLASVVFASLGSARAKARDANRLATMHQLQNALELYANDHNGAYPSTGGPWYSICTDGGSRTLTGSSGYIPNLAPTYIPTLPVDPKTGAAACSNSQGNAYLYNSNATDYILLAYVTAETYPTVTGNPMPRPLVDGSVSTCGADTGYERDFAIYSSGAMCW
jgi:prepilin-type N-terminal cleavage/methylation domain-containing protein